MHLTHAAFAAWNLGGRMDGYFQVCSKNIIKTFNRKNYTI
jgi:hypothetical protein